LPRSDAELVRDARDGDVQAFHELVERHADGLYALACSLVGDVHLAHDVVQETFLGAFRGLGSFAGRAAVKTWLVSILVRQAARQRERGHRWRPGGTVSLDAAEHGTEHQSLAVPDATAGTDARLDLMAVLEGLPDEYRQVIVLRELEGLAYQEIADLLGLPRGTVESRLFRARAALREKLGEE